MKAHGPAHGYWQAALGAHTPAAFGAVMDDFIDTLLELFPEEVHGNLTLETRDQWEEVAERLEWAGCRDYARFLRFGCRVLFEMEEGRAASVSFVRPIGTPPGPGLHPEET